MFQTYTFTYQEIRDILPNIDARQLIGLVNKKCFRKIQTGVYQIIPANHYHNQYIKCGG